MVRPRFRLPVILAPVAVIVLAASMIVFTATSKQTSELAQLAERQKDCAKQVKEYSHIMHSVEGRITAIIPHYNEARHQCLAEISSERPENGGKAVYDQIVDPKRDTLIGFRLRTVGERGMRDNTIVSGAPVRLEDKSGAESWFDGLMR
jgi:hypothetical protein